MRNLNFKTESIEEFNFNYDTSIHKSMCFYEVVDEIDDAENNYFYVSMCKEDVIEAINSEPQELIEQLELNLIFIADVGVYIALQP